MIKMMIMMMTVFPHVIVKNLFQERRVWRAIT